MQLAIIAQVIARFDAPGLGILPGGQSFHLIPHTRLDNRTEHGDGVRSCFLRAIGSHFSHVAPPPHRIPRRRLSRDFARRPARPIYHDEVDRSTQLDVLAQAVDRFDAQVLA